VTLDKLEEERKGKKYTVSH